MKGDDARTRPATELLFPPKLDRGLCADPPEPTPGGIQCFFSLGLMASEPGEEELRTVP